LPGVEAAAEFRWEYALDRGELAMDFLAVHDPNTELIHRRVTHWLTQSYKRVEEQQTSHPPPLVHAAPADAEISASIKVFVSYSWDDDAHKLWVHDFCGKLSASGIDVVVDETHLRPGASNAQFMEKSVRDCQRVLVICTEKYKERFDKRDGGVGYEGHIITAEMINNMGAEKFIPVLRGADWKGSLPTALSGFHGIDLRANSLQSFKKCGPS
jgi:hypothetical protein